ncbi:MAG: hypothetical protein SOW25_08230 [Helicobacter sp.]|nr:hypothetical protein [Helicobacter sp.]
MNREVFYIAGFDPRSPKYYYSIFKHNATKTSKIDSNSLFVSKLENNSFDISYKNCNIKYNFLDWSDITKAHFHKTFLSVFYSLVLFLKYYFFSKVHYKIIKHSRTQLIAGYYPLFFITLSYSLVFGILTILYNCFSWNLYLFLAVFSIAFLISTKIIFSIGNRVGIFWLLSIYIFCCKYAKGDISGMSERNMEFALKIVDSLRKNSKDEILLVSHSVGTILAISVAALVVKICKEQNISMDKLKLVTLGSCVPLTSLQKCALNFKQDLTILSKTNLIWLDFTSKIDGACFFMFDFVKIADIKAKFKPRYISVGFYRLYTKESYKKIRYKWYQVHFLYLKATEIDAGYDYFYLICDSKKLENKIF